MRQATGYWRLVTSVLALSLTASACTSTATVVDDQITPAPTTSTTLAPAETTSTLSSRVNPAARSEPSSGHTRTLQLRSSAMEPTIPDDAFITVDPNAYTNAPIERFDIILHRQTGPDGSVSEYIHRVLGLEGELLEYSGFDALAIDGLLVDQPETVQRPTDWIGFLTIPEGHVFVMGDNRPVSLDQDSRTFGPIAQSDVIGKVVSIDAGSQARVALDGTGCTSSIPTSWLGGALALEISNQTAQRMALVMGTYRDGFGRDDLVAYGRDISTRPEFIDALEIYEVPPESTHQVSFDHGRGRYFTVCMDSTSTMVVLNDLVVGD